MKRVTEKLYGVGMAVTTTRMVRVAPQEQETHRFASRLFGSGKTYGFLAISRFYKATK